jgi:hypothetical protein
MEGWLVYEVSRYENGRIESINHIGVYKSYNGAINAIKGIVMDQAENEDHYRLRLCEYSYTRDMFSKKEYLDGELNLLMRAIERWEDSRDVVMFDEGIESPIFKGIYYYIDEINIFD